MRKKRKELSDECLLELIKASPEKRGQAYQNWLHYATASEVREHWRPWMGAFPDWAIK